MCRTRRERNVRNCCLYDALVGSCVALRWLSAEQQQMEGGRNKLVLRRGKSDEEGV